MMHWSYRVMKRENELGEYAFGIYEVYYDESGKINGWTEKSLTPVYASADDLLHELTLMIEPAFQKETLLYVEE